ncbi:phosphohexomutase domain-containing protein [Syntrophotalea acetylenica]|uniref:Phosphomannomutase n=1 Tax=Syntrophotalea acetylenica TaxID=29542 RepID=A0A1L3GIA9_SYNAC|nr:phosphomannomutase [Syntrophotalea acetylenica]APG25687.1 phosphomannomutase [Syntrophotalea acetylenica]APG43759.1 phosphomannomutase [Syntrophotalea acetylenica]
MTILPCFKAYDIRGRLPDELNEDIAYRIGRAYAAYLRPGRVVVGRDVRLGSAALCDALAAGLMDGGAEVFDIGLCGTEEIYFATFAEDMDGGIMVTASHNPMDYNGMKLVRQGARPISGDSGLQTIRELAQGNQFTPVAKSGTRVALETRPRYIEHLLGYIDRQQLRPLKVVVNAGNGCAGPVLDQLERHLPFEFIKVHHEPDGSFPNGIPNPLLPENRSATAEAVVAHGADLGIAWDGDFDRCFLFDEQGSFIEGYYVVGLLAAAFLQHHPGARIIHDPRLTWNTMDLVGELGGTPVMSKTGHAFIKERMRQEDAVYGGEMSAHHYFRDFAYCDSGMIPWLLVTELMSRNGQPLSRLVGARIARYPASGEINRRLSDPAATLARIETHYRCCARGADYTDGLSMEFDRWRFNLRCSNTEPVVRLNVESRGDQMLMEQKTQEILAMMEG